MPPPPVRGHKPTAHGDPGRSRLRVAVLDHTASLGGAELALLRLLNHLRLPGLEVRTILFAQGPLADRLRQCGQSVEILLLSPDLAGADRHSAGRSALTAARNAVSVVPFVLRLGRHLRRLQPDVIYTTSLKADLIGVPVSWVANRPLVWHVHDRISPDYLPTVMVRLIRFLARRVPRHVIVNSQATASTLPGVPRLSIAYPGFDADQVGPAPDDRAKARDEVVGIIGRISPTKGQREFVRAAARVLQQRPGVRFRIIGAPLFGEDEYAEAVRREVDALGIAEAVEFTGFVDDPSAALDALTLCVHASGTPEPFGQVIVEAMIRGVPVVATTGGGVTEIVQPDPDEEPLGWLVPPGDVDALAHAILDALGDPERARRRAQAAWRSAQDRFPVEETARVVADVWHATAGHEEGE